MRCGKHALHDCIGALFDAKFAATMNTQTPLSGKQLLVADPNYVQGGTFLSRHLSARFGHILDVVDDGLAVGSIDVLLPNGEVRLLGGRGAGPSASVQLKNWRPVTQLWASGSVGGFQTWAKGDWSSPDLVSFFEVFMLNRRTLGNAGRAHGVSRLAKLAQNLLRRNSRAGAKRNIAAHYDLGNDFYAAWLDPTMTYSSALFKGDRDEPLELAQRSKVRALLDRLGLKPGDHLLEIGCGWGGLCEIAARDYGVRVTALTLSVAQKDYCEARVKTAGLSENVTIKLCDYRDETGNYDAIASVEMVEAVGQAYWPAFLDCIVRCLKPGARAAIQLISIDDAIFEGYSKNADFIQTYVFPGGMLISEDRFSKLAAARNLGWEHRHGFGQDYAETLRRWRMTFDAALDAGRLPGGFDKRFVDLWRYYLMYCEGGFRGGGIDVAQITLTQR
jgi:cyclopropane-fatty-acyl-phospholipid synthase